MKKSLIKKISFFLFLICTIFSATGGVCSSLADENAAVLASAKPSNAETQTASRDIKVSGRLYELLFKKQGGKEKCAYLIPGGDVFGIRIKEAHVTVTAAKEGSPLKRGDKILSIGETEIKETRDVESALNESGKKTVNIGIP